MTTRVAIVGGTGKLGGIIRAVVDEPRRLRGRRDAVVAVRALRARRRRPGRGCVDARPCRSTSCARRSSGASTCSSARPGWSAERIALVRPLVEAAGTGAVFIPNFSLGSVLGSALAAVAAPFFPSIEIVEAHRETKVDSPSGTAVRTAELIAARAPASARRVAARRPARPGPAGRQRADPFAAPARASSRGRRRSSPAPGESLTIVHDTIEPALAYGPASGSPSPPRATRGASSSDSTASSTSASAAPGAARDARRRGRRARAGRARHRRMSARIGVAVMAALLVLYIVLVGQRAWLLLTSGEPIAVAMGVALVVLPIIAVWALGRELWFGVRAERLGRRLEAEGALPADEVAVRPSGRVRARGRGCRVPRATARMSKSHPEDWRAWYRLGLAYDARAATSACARGGAPTAIRARAGRAPAPLSRRLGGGHGGGDRVLDGRVGEREPGCLEHRRGRHPRRR